VKTCKKCGESKGLDAFSGARSECKACAAKCTAKWRDENPEKDRARYAKYRAENPEKVRAIRAKYRAENSEKLRASLAKYRAENVEKEMARLAKWRAENPEKVRASLAKCRASLTDGYIAELLGLPVKKAPPQLIELKREQILLHRLAKEMKQEATKEPT